MNNRPNRKPRSGSTQVCANAAEAPPAITHAMRHTIGGQPVEIASTFHVSTIHHGTEHVVTVSAWALGYTWIWKNGEIRVEADPEKRLGVSARYTHEHVGADVHCRAL